MVAADRCRLILGAVLVVLVACAAHAPATHGRSTRTLGTAQGIVRWHGRSLAGVTVDVFSPHNPQHYAVRTDDHGFFRIDGLPPSDDYTLTFAYGNETRQRRGIRVGAGQSVSVSEPFDQGRPLRVPWCSAGTMGICFP
jgi:hypothetical protein